MKHWRNIINVYDVRCRIDESLMLLITALLNHQCYQCVLYWGSDEIKTTHLSYLLKEKLKQSSASILRSFILIWAKETIGSLLTKPKFSLKSKVDWLTKVDSFRFFLRFFLVCYFFLICLKQWVLWFRGMGPGERVDDCSAVSCRFDSFYMGDFELSARQIHQLTLKYCRCLCLVPFCKKVPRKR